MGHAVARAFEEQEVAVMDQSLTINALFVSGAGGLISGTTAQGTSYYSYNPHSDTSLITDASGNISSLNRPGFTGDSIA